MLLLVVSRRPLGDGFFHPLQLLHDRVLFLDDDGRGLWLAA